MIWCVRFLLLFKIEMVFSERWTYADLSIWNDMLFQQF